MNKGVELESLRNEIKSVGKILEDRYRKIFSQDRDEFRKKLLEHTGEIVELPKLDEKKIVKFKNLVGIDGSYNKSGGNFPHYIELYRALGLRFDKESVVVNEIFTPLLQNTLEEENNMKKRLAEIELNCAIESIMKLNPKYIMMDGGLIRYNLDAKDKFEELLEIVDEKDIVLFGVVKDVKTDYIRRSFDWDEFYYDRELMFGILQKGEALLINNSVNKKFSYSLSSAFLRSSTYPGVIGIDVYNRNKTELFDIASLIYTLTPENSRGVPYFLDIVDSEVKITNIMMESLLKDNLDRGYYERFFVSERDKRSMK